MTFNNSKTIINIRIKLFAATVILLAYLSLAYLIKLIRFPLLGMSDVLWTFLLTSAWVIMAFLPMILNYQFISYSDEDDNIIFRYFTAGIVGGRKNSVEIKKQSFAGYKINKSFFGLIESIILYQRIKEGIAKYPPVYISILTREEKAKLIKSLNLHCSPI